MRLSFDENARRELESARRFYGGISTELALRFVDEVEHGLRRIGQTPTSWPPYWRRTRRYLLASFPYHLVYIVRGEDVVIVAVAHARRDPAYWHHRIRDSED